MTVSIRTNLDANRAANQFNRVQRSLAGTMERVITGKRVNRAADDPAAALAITNMDARVRELNTQIERTDFQIAYLGAREGLNSVISDLAVDLESVYLQATNRDSLSSSERSGLQIQAEEIIKAIQFISATTTFNGQRVADPEATPTPPPYNPNPPSDSSDPPTNPPVDPDANAPASLTNLKTKKRFNIVSGDDESIASAYNFVKGYTAGIAANRAAIGNQIRQFESNQRQDQTELDTLLGVRSSIQDSDLAKEVSDLVRTQALKEAASFATQAASLQNADTVRTLLAAATPAPLKIGT